jgi:hypothetical protein
MPDYVWAFVALIGLFGLNLVGTILRRRRRAKMTLEQRQAAELVPWYRNRIR